MGLPGAGTSHLGELNGTFEHTNTTTSTQYIKIVGYKHDSTTTWYMGQYSSSSVGLTILRLPNEQHTEGLRNPDPTNGNTALEVDSSGRILTPNRPMFKV